MTTLPKVLIATQSYPRHSADPHGTFIATHARALRDAGVQVRILCPSVDGAPVHEQVPLTVDRFRYAPRHFERLAGTGAMHVAARGSNALILPAYVAANVLAVRRTLHSVDLVHAHWWAPTGLACVIGARAKPVVVHIHGTDAAIAPPGSIAARLARVVLRRAAAVLAVSADLVEWVGAVSGVTAQLAPMPLDPRTIAEPTPAPPTGPLLAVGRLVPEKGFDVLIEAVARGQVPLTLVGDGPARTELEELARRRAAPVTFVGAVPPTGLPHLYMTARAVVVPSRREGFGLVAAEALASGRTVVASAVGGLVDIVRPGVNGVLVPPGDPEALAAALAALDLGLGSNGPATVAHLSSAEVAAREIGLYRTLSEHNP